jgi:glycosyltransferase involved in cell wall biosynthesis
VIEAIGKLKDSRQTTLPDIALLAAGGQRPAYVTEVLNPLIDQYGLHNNVFFTDFIDADAFGPFIQLADVCVCPHIKTELTDTTFPNKVYLYSYFQKAVLASNCDPLKRYVDKTGAGISFASEDPDDCAEKLKSLITNSEQRFAYGQDGHQAVTALYNWGQEKIKLLELYNELCPPTLKPATQGTKSSSRPSPAATQSHSELV